MDPGQAVLSWRDLVVESLVLQANGPQAAAGAVADLSLRFHRWYTLMVRMRALRAPWCACALCTRCVLRMPAAHACLRRMP